MNVMRGQISLISIEIYVLIVYKPREEMVRILCNSPGLRRTVEQLRMNGAADKKFHNAMLKICHPRLLKHTFAHHALNRHVI